MGLSGKLVFDVEIKSPVHGFLDIYGTKKYNLPKIVPDLVQSLELVKGDWGAVGCILRGYFYLDGKVVFSEETIIDVDEENRSITYDIYKGDLSYLYKKLHVTVQITTKGEANFVTWIYDYEKVDENAPDPHALVEFVTDETKFIDAYFLKMAKGN